MNLRLIDLNLLVVLDVLLDEAHVSRAAERLALSQPAASSALERCRHLFGDPLLLRGRGVMRLTPKAEALRGPLKTLLADTVKLLDPPVIDLADLRQTVRIVMSDFPAAVIAGPMHRHLAQTAPGIDLVIVPWVGAAAAQEALEKGEADLAVSVFPDPGEVFRRETLLHETYVVAMRRNHPAAADFDLESWLAFPHVLVSGRGQIRGALDEALAVLGRARRVGMVVPSFLIVPPLLEASDLIALLPSRCIPADAAGRFAVFEPPIAVEGFPLHLAWHARRDRDAGVQHVAGNLRALLSSGE
ncbi:LysR family transcriptional regulator [Manganibacter manganicus]|uniref:LysR family transcriptional regulator n=1 Tax=Manganibacter manganicus TaxID=1873176 RepID=A0A1V8RUU3_9HYPH|nr:LysR family transcriptional regulator [Pseudaminobacter manganicus]OQM76970.1 LysR family transcriptional regulator [Pseudaminobacter manganicus]